MGFRVLKYNKINLIERCFELWWISMDHKLAVTGPANCLFGCKFPHPAVWHECPFGPIESAEFDGEPVSRLLRSTGKTSQKSNNLFAAAHGAQDDQRHHGERQCVRFGYGFGGRAVGALRRQGEFVDGQAIVGAAGIDVNPA